MARNYWLMKCEPTAYTIANLARDGSTSWEGVRNYQARNFMRDTMKVGDAVLFYASNAEPSGVTGIAKVSREFCFANRENREARFVAGQRSKVIRKTCLCSATPQHHQTAKPVEMVLVIFSFSFVSN